MKALACRKTCVVVFGIVALCVVVAGVCGNWKRFEIEWYCLLLRQGDDASRLRASKSLVALGAVQTLPTLIDWLVHDPNLPQESSKFIALNGLVEKWPCEALPYLCECLLSSDVYVRRHSVFQIGIAIKYMDDTCNKSMSVISRLAVGLDDSDLVVKRCCAGVLGDIGSPAMLSVPTLRRHLSDNDVGMRMSVQEALRRITGGE